MALRPYRVRLPLLLLCGLAGPIAGYANVPALPVPVPRDRRPRPYLRATSRVFRAIPIDAASHPSIVPILVRDMRARRTVAGAEAGAAGALGSIFHGRHPPGGPPP